MKNGKSKRLVIACMDRRLNKFLDDKFNDGNTLFLRNAGANAFCIEDDIKKLVKEENIKHVHIVTHKDCKAMLIVYEAMAKHKHFSKRITKNLISCFTSLEKMDREGLEKSDGKVQSDIIKGIYGKKLKITAELVDLNKINVPSSHSGELFLMVTEPTTDKYQKMCDISNLPIGMTYFLQARNPKHLEHDIEIALSMLHIKTARFFAMSSSDEGLMQKEIANLENQRLFGKKNDALILRVVARKRKPKKEY